jgi:hypothetical protein
MRPLLVSLAGILGILGLHGSRPANPETVQVHVDLQCTGPGQHTSNVDPDTAVLAQGDELEWVLDSTATTDNLTITPKQAAWPFADSTRYHGHRHQHPHAKRMKANQHGHRFGYSVQMICIGASTDTVNIDPQIIIH